MNWEGTFDLDLTDPGYLRGLYRSLAEANTSMSITDQEHAWLTEELPRIHQGKQWETGMMIGYDYGRVAGEHLAQRRGDRDQYASDWSLYERDRMHPGDHLYFCFNCGSDLDYNPETDTWVCSGTRTETEVMF